MHAVLIKPRCMLTNFDTALACNMHACSVYLMVVVKAAARYLNGSTSSILILSTLSLLQWAVKAVPCSESGFNMRFSFKLHVNVVANNTQSASPKLSPLRLQHVCALILKVLILHVHWSTGVGHRCIISP